MVVSVGNVDVIFFDDSSPGTNIRQFKDALSELQRQKDAPRLSIVGPEEQPDG